MLKRTTLALVAVFGYAATAAAQQVDPNVPVNIPVQDLNNYPGMLDQVLADILTPATPPLLAFGENLWTGLAVIVVVWTGLRIAYSGSFNGWELVRLLIGLWIPWSMLLFYDTPIPGTAFTFPMTISAGGNWLAARFASDVVDLMFTELTTLISNYTASLSSAWNVGSVWNMLTSGTSALFTLVGTAAIVPLFILALVLTFAVAYAQVIWATVAISILIFLGPAFIPFMVFEPLAFLFWGWFRAMVTYALYSVIAAVMLRVWGGIALGYVTTLSNTTLDPASLGWSAAWFASLLPLLIAALLSSLKVGEIASMLVSGGGSGGSGLMGMAGMALAATGGGRVLRAAAGAGSAGKAAGSLAGGV